MPDEHYALVRAEETVIRDRLNQRMEAIGAGYPASHRFTVSNEQVHGGDARACQRVAFRIFSLMPVEPGKALLVAVITQHGEHRSWTCWFRSRSSTWRGLSLLNSKLKGWLRGDL
jgi:hypothetical protein